MKKEIPILFSIPMVKAIIAGRKTMTRRIIKPRTPEDFALMVNMNAGANVQKSIEELVRCSSPYGKTGDILYVRESFYCYGKWVKNGTTKLGRQKWKFVPDSSFENFRYMEDQPLKLQKNSDRVTGWYKRPGLFMPKVFVRIFLEVTNIKVERLHDITEADAKAEGVEQNTDGSWHDYLEPNRLWQDSAKASFQSLWMKLNGEESWNENPWVWVISFKVISTTGRPSPDFTPKQYCNGIHQPNII